ncbi:hypothetical protein [Grylomicrobium aquisgranensis]|uniref:hypothetical protein n=1 Tax=Grylomicrobium aquisgranensis TaxID=2926318 RepID=UPI00351C1EFF
MFRNETHHLFLFLHYPKADHQETMAASSTTSLETVIESPVWNPYDAGAADGVTAGRCLLQQKMGKRLPYRRHMPLPAREAK